MQGEPTKDGTTAAGTTHYLLHNIALGPDGYWSKTVNLDVTGSSPVFAALLYRGRLVIQRIVNS